MYGVYRSLRDLDEEAGLQCRQSGSSLGRLLRWPFCVTGA
jgi:hypothetical protein